MLLTQVALVLAVPAALISSVWLGVRIVRRVKKPDGEDSFVAELIGFFVDD
jgi:hypothetical protein